MDEKRKKNRTLVLIFGGTIFLVVLPLIFIFSSLFLDSVFNVPPVFIFPLNLLVGIPCTAFGFAWGLWSNVYLFRKGSGSPVPTRHTETAYLVDSGPYKYCRNPMIFGTAFIYAGVGILLDALFLILVFTPAFFLLLVFYVKFIEEKGLEKRFGDSYLEYKKRTSFIIPLPRKK
ncbi:MAG: methyltransferase family protein [Candidatus Helarchaeales archaeon]